jgi:putative ABC transport system substrate-binding protein
MWNCGVKVMRNVKNWVVLLGLGWALEAHAENTVQVAVGQIVEHQALDTLRMSLKEGLEKKGFMQGKNLTWSYENAQGSAATAAQIAQKFISQEPTVIVTLSTPMTQAVATATTKIPIVFGAVTDPESAKLTSQKNVTGLTDFVPPEKQIELVKAILPNVKTIGLIYNSGEVNSQKQVEDIQKYCEKNGLRVEIAAVTKSNDVPIVARTLIGKVDAILLPTDNTVISSLEAIVKIAITHNIPVFGSDVDIVRRGAVAAYGVDWRASGEAMADIVSQILNGTSVKKIPIQNPNNLVLHINMDAAKRMNVGISEDLKKKANFIYE